MKRYTYVAMMLIAFLTGCYFSCQCNNPTMEEPEPTTTQPDNPQSGDPTPSAGFGPGKHRGIQRRSDWNTCYMNSTLQVLFALYGDLVKAKCAGAADGTMAAHMLKLFNKVTKVDGSAITDDEIKDFYDSMTVAENATKNKGGINWTEPWKQQADGSELLLHILDFLDVPKMKTIKESTNSVSGKKKYKEDAQSVKLDVPFNDGITNMQGAIDMYFQEEIMEGENAVDWDGVKQKTNCKIKLKELDKIYNNTLIISLGRFQSDRTKINKEINSPFEIKIRKDHTTDLPTDMEYKLIAFIHHGGTYSSGHYIAYIKEGTKWICYNDSNVSEVSDAATEAAAKQAYVFFYQPK